MKVLSTTTIVGGLVVLSDALNLVKKTVPAVAEASIQRRSDILRPQIHDRIRRDASTIGLDLSNEQTLYFANVSLGTPPQDLSLHIDTGSSDLWVNTPTSELCSRARTQCQAAGTYSANSSSTYKYVNSLFNITYVDGSGAQGDYATDNLILGALTLDTLQFGIGYSSSSAQGILGLGYAANEVIVSNAGQKPYNNVPAALSADGVIAVNAFSLWLNDLQASTGSILFGGVNTAKFSGSLYTLPVVSEFGTFSQFIIALTGIGQNGNANSITSNQAIPVLLDSGSSLTYLPNDITTNIYNAFNAKYDASSGSAIVDCSLADESGSLDFTFSNDENATISVDLSELVLLGGYNNGQPYCIFGIAPAGNTNPVLGDTFLRSAYVVYDLSANEISLGKTNFNATGDDNVLEISSATTGGVPSATMVPSPVTQVTGLQSGGARAGTGGVLTVTSEDAARITSPPRAAYGAAAIAGIGAMMAL